MAQGIERGDASAEKRSGFSGVERVGHSGNCFRGGEHVLGVAAVVADAGDFFVHASNEVAAAALQAGSVMAAVPANSYALTFLPIRHTRSDLINGPGNFVAGRARISDAWEKAVFDDMVAEANAAGLDADADVTRGRLRDVAFLKFKVSAGLGDYSDFHFGHRNFLACGLEFFSISRVGCNELT